MSLIRLITHKETGFPHHKRLLLPSSQATTYTLHVLGSQRAGKIRAPAPEHHSTQLLEGAEQSQAAFKDSAASASQAPALHTHLNHSLAPSPLKYECTFRGSPWPSKHLDMEQKREKLDRQKTVPVEPITLTPPQELAGRHLMQGPAAHCCCNQRCKLRGNLAGKRTRYSRILVPGSGTTPAEISHWLLYNRWIKHGESVPPLFADCKELFQQAELNTGGFPLPSSHSRAHPGADCSFSPGGKHVCFARQERCARVVFTPTLGMAVHHHSVSSQI